mmetsp:Transcript_14628/g.49942  ORF Transcript_14628/g.49942 Transcript_14628/m.49942 type:complete len:313 (+) Transcript_14628:37-975(+)
MLHVAHEGRVMPDEEDWTVSLSFQHRHTPVLPGDGSRQLQRPEDRVLVVLVDDFHEGDPRVRCEGQEVLMLGQDLGVVDERQDDPVILGLQQVSQVSPQLRVGLRAGEGDGVVETREGVVHLRGGMLPLGSRHLWDDAVPPHPHVLQVHPLVEHLCRVSSLPLVHHFLPCVPAHQRHHARVEGVAQEPPLVPVEVREAILIERRDAPERPVELQERSGGVEEIQDIRSKLHRVSNHQDVAVLLRQAKHMLDRMNLKLGVPLSQVVLVRFGVHDGLCQSLCNILVNDGAQLAMLRVLGDEDVVILDPWELKQC